MLVGRGLGAAPSVLYPGTPVETDCSIWYQYALAPECWQYSPSGWAQMNAVAIAAGQMPAPHPPAGPSTIQQETVPGAWTPDQAISVAKDQTTAQLQDYFGQAAQSIAAVPNVQTTNYWMWGALILGGAIALMAAGKAL